MIVPADTALMSAVKRVALPNIVNVTIGMYEGRRVWRSTQDAHMLSFLAKLYKVPDEPRSKPRIKVMGTNHVLRPAHNIQVTNPAWAIRETHRLRDFRGLRDHRC